MKVKTINSCIDYHFCLWFANNFQKNHVCVTCGQYTLGIALALTCLTVPSQFYTVTSNKSNIQTDIQSKISEFS